MVSLFQISPRQEFLLCWKQLSLLFLLISLDVPLAFSWGPEGHAYINQSAALKASIPMAGFPSFFRSDESIQIITYNGSEPDRWKRFPGYRRHVGHSLAHYINFELIQDLPEARDHIFAIQMYQEKGIDTGVEGLLPYYILETYEKLKVSFREYRDFVKRGYPTKPIEVNILYYAGLLAIMWVMDRNLSTPPFITTAGLGKIPKTTPWMKGYIAVSSSN